MFLVDYVICHKSFIFKNCFCKTFDICYQFAKIACLENYMYIHVHDIVGITSPALQSTNCHGCEVGGDGDILPEAVHTEGGVCGVWLAAQPLCTHQGHQITRHRHLH